MFAINRKETSEVNVKTFEGSFVQSDFNKKQKTKKQKNKNESNNSSKQFLK